MPQNLINDGYTRRGRIAPAPGIHAGLSFEYRPLLHEQVEELAEASRKVGAVKAVQLKAAAIKRQLVSWDETDKTGAIVEITPDAIRRLPGPLFLTLENMISGYIAGDPLPEVTGEEASEFLKAVEAEAAGKPPGLVALEASQKN